MMAEPNEGDDDTLGNSRIQGVISDGDGDEDNSKPMRSKSNSEVTSRNEEPLEEQQPNHASEASAPCPQPLYTTNYYIPGQPPSIAPHPSYLYSPHQPTYNPYENHHTSFHPAPFFPAVPPFAMHPLPHTQHMHPAASLLPSFGLDGPPSNYNSVVSSSNNAAAIAQAYHEQAARMRDHAAAYANMAASAAFIASQIANAAAEFTDEIKRSNMHSHSIETNNCTNQQHFTDPCSSSQAILSCLQHSSPHYLHVPENNLFDNPRRTLTEADPSKESLSYERKALGRAETRNNQRNVRNTRKVDEDPFTYPRNRRKRHQHILPEELVLPRDIPKTSSQQHQQREKVRRRLRSDGDSSTTSSGSSFMPHSNSSLASQKCRSGNHHNKKKARSDESLIGKTAVAALFEWCSKRRITPNFVLEQKSPEEFDFIVYLDEDELDEELNFGSCGDRVGNREWGRGRGRNKVVGKQEAARKTLQMLIPGVVFDEETGLLLELPPPPSSVAPAQRRKSPTSSSLDDLAPNLAKQLAIGRESVVEQVSIQNHQAKRSFDIYPGTSTTSEDEDENTYYTSRGASVCSVLLHAMIQIDTTRLPEAPSFTYQVGPTPVFNNKFDEPRRKESDGTPVAAGRATRGSFICTARLKIRSTCGSENLQVSTAGNEIDTEETHQFLADSESFLEAIGVGGTKRDSRHIASAKLLAMLFPDCKDMKEVKSAAESLREKYAASKSLKYQTTQTGVRRPNNDLAVDNDCKTLVSEGRHALIVGISKRSDPPLPFTIESGFRALLGDYALPCHLDGSMPAGNLSSSTSLIEANDSSVSAFRHLSRQKQVDFRVETALQICNDRDEEGRVLPEELTDDDVGRLVLRRAEPEDLPRIKKFRFVSGVSRRMTKSPFESPNPDSKKASPSMLTKTGSWPETEESSLTYLWSSSTIVLLLCRAIAAYEDPPLGCAVLTLGFSIEDGCTLRLAQIASEKHLPIERFLDYLQNFANCMKCELDTESLSEWPKIVVLSSNDCQAIIESHIPIESGLMTKKSSDQFGLSAANVVGKEVFREQPSKLQSVQEESEVSDSSSNDKRLAKRNDKPSKRSRFQ